MKGKYLITTDAWFICPDGDEYRGVWGDVEILEDLVMGIKTNRMSSNWYAKVGTKENHVIIAGCQIHYAVRCENEPKTDGCKSWDFSGGQYNEQITPNRIYLAK
tara:strand:+ start:21128 stop:21439 length:312 start_codon:yes stop_codon:yes gene_type:complete